MLAFHDPDLNYHLNQVNKLDDCGRSGYSYPIPPVQLSSGVKPVLPIPGPAPPAYAYNANAYSAGAYQSALNSLQYGPPPPVGYQQQYINHPSSSYARQELHGYATSAGLSQFRGPTVIPQATYAQAPIISKITAAPLIAKYAITGPKPSYLPQNSLPHQAAAYAAAGSFAKASLYNGFHSGGPVVSQVIAAPTVRYAAHPAIQPQQLAPPPPPPVYGPPRVLPRPQYSAPTVAQYFSADQYPAPPAPAAPVNYAAPNPFLPPVGPLPIKSVGSIAKNVHREFLENYVSTTQLF